MAGKASKIEVGGNWSYEDSLDGVPLKNGERLSIAWPDGSRETVSVVVETYTETGNDMGEAINVPVSEAYHVIERRGAKYRARLVGLRAERIKPARSSRERGTR